MKPRDLPMEDRVRHVLHRLIDENPLASRGLLSICGLEFTTSVPSAGATLGARPRLLINPEFLKQHVQDDDDIAVLVLHEFLHVLLRHTGRFKAMTPLMNVVLDMQVNSCLSRLMGADRMGLLHRLYAAEKGIVRLLAPPDNVSRMRMPSELAYPHSSMYEHREYSWRDAWDQFAHMGLKGELPFLLGDHSARAEELTPEQRVLVDAAFGQNAPNLTGKPADIELQARERSARMLAALRHVIRPRSGQSARSLAESIPTYLPVLSPGDRRAALRALWSPIIPVSAHETQAPRSRLRVYLDVSGSMASYLSSLAGLLHGFRDEIEWPLWAFSTEVHPARFVQGGIETRTTGGTHFTCVIDHLRERPAERALVISDGLVHRIPLPLPCPIQAILCRNGFRFEFENAGIPILEVD